jgi:hypothetical protein
MFFFIEIIIIYNTYINVELVDNYTFDSISVLLTI